MIIAIDGPAGSGKSTIARYLADTLGFVFMNTGSFYRGVTSRTSARMAAARTAPMPYITV